MGPIGIICAIKFDSNTRYNSIKRHWNKTICSQTEYMRNPALEAKSDLKSSHNNEPDLKNSNKGGPGDLNLSTNECSDDKKNLEKTCRIPRVDGRPGEEGFLMQSDQ